MSVVCCAFVPEGIILAADSRTTTSKRGENSKGETTVSRYSLSDNTEKIVLLSKAKVGIAHWGDAFVDVVAISKYIRIFENEQVKDGDSVVRIADKLHNYLPKALNIGFFVCGYNEDEPFVYNVNSSFSKRLNKDNEAMTYNASWHGSTEAINRLVNTEPSPSFLYSLMPLKDAIDICDYFVDLTIKYERFRNDIQTCGGPIDILVITKDDAFWYRHKTFKPYA